MVTLCTQLRLSLTELDRRFSYLMEGRTYHGEAINPRGLSVWERLTRIGKVSLFPLHGCCLYSAAVDYSSPFRCQAVQHGHGCALLQ